jgi:hypothetical protein
MIRFRALVLAAAAAALQPAAAQLPAATQTTNVVISPGASGAHYEGRILVRQTFDYVLEASRGQRLTLRYASRNGLSAFDLYPPGGGVPLHVGSAAGGSFDQMLEVSGPYRVRVYMLPGSEARDDASRFTLDFGLASGVATGPEFWTVDGVGTGGLLIFHEAPSTTSRGVGSAADGNVLRNFGCRDSEGRRWCRVGSLRNTAVTGWVDASFLRAGGRPGAVPPPPKR